MDFFRRARRITRVVARVLPAGALIGAVGCLPSSVAHVQAGGFIPTANPGPALSVRVSGNNLVDGNGNPLRLLGVDRSGTEYACAQGWGIFDGPSDAASVAAMASWHINAVRVPLNEDCWLAINGVAPAYSGTNYMSAIESYVGKLNAAGIVGILDLHWSAPGTNVALGQQVMPDADHSPAFWSSVASAFKSNPGVVFDLYNEPHDVSWSCWLNGCVTSGGWQAAGMQSLVNAVRSTGASQPVMVGGLGWSGDLSGWLANRPTDPINQTAASAHIYNFSACSGSACWNQVLAPLSKQVPIVTGELGEDDCASGFIDSYMSWADAHNVSYLGWAWDTYSCGGFPALITSYDGTPTAFGAGFQSHLASLWSATQPAPPGKRGYRVAGADGAVYSFASPSYGSMAGTNLSRPVVGMASTAAGDGYWLVGSDGGIFSFGHAPFYGSTGSLNLNRPITGMALDPGTGGYWLVASDGGVFSFDAPFYGSAGSIHLNKPVVGMAATPDGGGYWLVASDGGIFSFGDARFYGSTGAIHLNRPVVGMAATPDGGGYWLVASDGGIFSFGDARFYGSTGAIHLNQAIVGMCSSPDGGGYNLVGADGGIFGFGDAAYLGSVPGLGVAATDIVGVSGGT